MPQLHGVATASFPISTETCAILKSTPEPSTSPTCSLYVVSQPTGSRLLTISQYVLDVLIAVAGFAMFGQKVRDEVTSSILLTEGYPHAISICIVVFIAIIPITKIPLK